MTKTRRNLLFTLPLTLLTLVVSACASLGTPEDQGTAKALWNEMEGFTSWQQFPEHQGIKKGTSGVHGDYVATWINATAAGDMANLPPGSILVKENFSSNDRKSLDGITVMKRIAGYDPDNEDWFFARYSASGSLTHAGKVSMCSDCHSSADGDDFSFLND